MYAVRNIRLCTKDCLCLYVCPTGATDTENSIIDVDKCTGCGMCAQSCPSGAISMIPKQLPAQQPKEDQVISAMRALMRSKCQQENIAGNLDGRLAQAIEKSNRIMAEDIIREAGYMLPQSKNAYEFLKGLLDYKNRETFPTAAVDKLLQRIKFNEEIGVGVVKQEKWQCTVCGYIHEGAIPDEFTCPRCKKPASYFDEIQ